MGKLNFSFLHFFASTLIWFVYVFTPKLANSYEDESIALFYLGLSKYLPVVFLTIPSIYMFNRIQSRAYKLIYFIILISFGVTSLNIFQTSLSSILILTVSVVMFHISYDVLYMQNVSSMKDFYYTDNIVSLGNIARKGARLLAPLLLFSSQSSLIILTLLIFFSIFYIRFNKKLSIENKKHTKINLVDAFRLVTGNKNLILVFVALPYYYIVINYHEYLFKLSVSVKIDYFFLPACLALGYVVSSIFIYFMTRNSNFLSLKRDLCISFLLSTISFSLLYFVENYFVLLGMILLGVSNSILVTTCFACVQNECSSNIVGSVQSLLFLIFNFVGIPSSSIGFYFNYYTSFRNIFLFDIFVCSFAFVFAIIYLFSSERKSLLYQKL